MKAIVFERYGPPEVLHLREVEKPVPKDNEACIKVFVSTVAAPDWRVRQANPWITRLFMGFIRPKRRILGYEFAGIIDAVGKDVKKFHKNDRVFGMNLTSMMVHFGTYAEYLCMPEDRFILLKPDNVEFEQAAVVPSGGITALLGLRAGNLKAGQRVLINGASGSIGTYAIQLARYFGAEVTGVCSTTNLELVRSLGAGQVIDYTVADFTRSGQHWDFIFDTVGTRSFAECRNSLTQNGIYLSSGPGNFIQNLVYVLWTSMVGNKRAKIMTDKAEIEHLVFLRDLLESGELTPVIDKIYPMENIVNAHRYVDKGHKKGNVVITIAGPDPA